MFTTNNFSSTYSQFSSYISSHTSETPGAPDDIILLTREVESDITMTTEEANAFFLTDGEHPSESNTLPEYENGTNNNYEIFSEPPEDININIVTELGFSDSVDVVLGCLVIVLSIVAFFGKSEF